MDKPNESVSEPEILYGIFKEEIKNRFLCCVEIDGKDTECYIPSSCRLSNFLNLRNTVVMLKPTTSRNARTRYAVYAVRQSRQFILLNLSEANRLIEANICRRYFSFLGKRKHISRERIIDGYKCDIFIEDTKTILEVKSILGFDKEAYFPSVYSERAIKQLRALSSLIDKGYSVCYVFVSLNPKVKKLGINLEVAEFADLFNECTGKGMTCVGFSAALEAQGRPELKSKLTIEL